MYVNKFLGLYRGSVYAWNYVVFSEIVFIVVSV